MPYFGACIHVPAPPPNQIIYVKFPKRCTNTAAMGCDLFSRYAKTESISHDLAQTGYLIEGTAIEEYDDM
ncbi:DUF3299 domain-containing protein [Vibrio lentus]|nr:DUF3299 domain-containing protein [Vibrio lentus]